MTRTAERFHEDPGLQPERTVLSWGRTMLALCTAAAIFLRWLPMQGPLVLALFGVGMVAGNLAGAKLADRALMPTVGGVLVWSAACVAGVRCGEDAEEEK